MNNHYCDCERGGNCTRTTMCHVQSVVSDLEGEHEIEIERLTAELKLYRTGEAYSLAAERISDMEAVLKRLSILPVGSLDTLEGTIAAVHIIASEGLTD